MGHVTRSPKEKIELVKRHCKKVSQKNDFCEKDLNISTLSYLLDMCQDGDGIMYETLVLKSLCVIFKHIIDSSLVERQYPVTGGKVDAILPFRTEVLERYSFWKAWYHRYKIGSFIIEMKNYKEKASSKDIRQIKNYIQEAKQGNFGFIIARNGYQDEALRLVRSSLDEDMLIIPLDNNDVKQLLFLTNCMPNQIFRYLCEKERVLRRSIYK